MKKKTNTPFSIQKSIEGHIVVRIMLKNIQHYWITWYLHFMTNSINQIYHIFSHESFRVFCLAFIRFQSIYYIFITFRWIFVTWELMYICTLCSVQCAVANDVSANEHLFRWKYSMEQRSDIIMSETRQRLMDERNFMSKIFRSLMSVKVTFVCLNNDINDNITI